MDAHAAPQNRTAHLAARQDSAPGDDGIQRLSAPAFEIEDELGGRIGVPGGAQRPLPVVQVQNGRHGPQIHAGFEIGVQRPYVAPVHGRPLRVARNAVGLKIVGVHVRAPNQFGQNIASEIVGALFVRGIRVEFGQQRFSGKYVVPHGRVNPAGISRHGGGIRILFVETGDGSVLAGFDHAELAGLAFFHGNRRNGYLRALFHMELHHLADVHSVNMIGAEDAHQVRLGLFNQVDVLENRVRRSAVPILAGRPHLRRNRDNKIAAQQPARLPSFAQMLQQGLALKLHQDIRRIYAGVHQVAENEIDNPVAPSERNRGLGPLFRQRIKTGAFAARKNKGQYSHLHLIGLPSLYNPLLFCQRSDR